MPRGNSKVIIHTSDTEVLLIALGCLEHIPESIKVCFEVGLYAKNSLRYIDIRKLFNKLGKIYIEPYQHSMFLLVVTILQRFQEKEKFVH